MLFDRECLEGILPCLTFYILKMNFDIQWSKGSLFGNKWGRTPGPSPYLVVVFCDHSVQMLSAHLLKLMVALGLAFSFAYCNSFFVLTL